MVRQHDAAGTYAYALGRRRDLPDHDLGCGTRDRRQVVMFGDPIARVAKAVGEPREVERIAQGDGAGGARGYRRQIEDGKGDVGPCRHALVRTAMDAASSQPSSL